VYLCLLQVINDQFHAKRELGTYEKKCGPRPAPRLRRSVWSGSALFTLHTSMANIFLAVFSICLLICVFNTVLGLILVYTICKVRVSLFAWRWPNRDHVADLGLHHLWHLMVGYLTAGVTLSPFPQLLQFNPLLNISMFGCLWNNRHNTYFI